MKEVLTDKDNGKLIPVEIVANVSYFYNTLEIKHHSSNPLHEPELFPALLYKNENEEHPMTLLEKNMKLVFP
jgi:TATA-box binding protein (TBP) (component of TFIID and TFIIIB)